MRISSEQRQLVQEIQRLAMAGSEQTGVYICHSVSTNTYGLDSTVMFMIDDTPSLQATTSKYLTEYTTLEQQRDELAEWIAKHRKQVAA